MRNRIIHCPRKQQIHLRSFLRALMGMQISVKIPGDTITGRITQVTFKSFRVGQVDILYETSFYLTLPPMKRELPYKATVSIEELDAVSGRLVRLCLDFVIIRLSGTPLTGIPVLVPLNQFTQLTCEKDDEE